MRKSVGIIPHKVINGKHYFFAGHPGGCKDDYWAYLKGGMEKDEDEKDTALREFKEESGVDLEKYSDRLVYLGQVKQNPKKNVSAYLLNLENGEDIYPDSCFSNLCENGVTPEIDKYRWIEYEELKNVTHKKHIQFYDKAVSIIDG